MDMFNAGTKKKMEEGFSPGWPKIALGTIFDCQFTISQSLAAHRRLYSTLSHMLVLEQDICCMALVSVVSIHSKFLILCYNSIPGLSRLLSTLLQRHSLIQAGFRDQNVQDWSMSPSSTCFTLILSQMLPCASTIGKQLHWSSHFVVLQVWYLECWSCHAGVDSRFSTCFPDQWPYTCFNGASPWRVEWANKGACIQVRH